MKIKELLYDTYFGGCGCDCGRPTYSIWYACMTAFFGGHP